MDCCFALMWAHQHGMQSWLSQHSRTQGRDPFSQHHGSRSLAGSGTVCLRFADFRDSTQPQKLDTVPVTNSYNWQLLLRVILEQERIKVLYPILPGTLWSPRYRSSGNQNAAIVGTDPISYLESPGFLFSELAAGATAAPRR